MAHVSFCPSGEELNQFARGTLEPSSAERVIHHLSQCRDCLTVLEKLPVQDTLIEAFQTWSDAAGSGDKAEIKGLIQRLKTLKSEAAPDPQATAADVPAVDKTDRSDFLSPQGADELGRLGGYRIVKPLGAGGMGMVYQAEDVRLKRKAALKVMKPELAANEGIRQRFLREAESCAALQSDHVVTIYQVGEQGGTPFLAMEYLEGLSLADWLGKGRKPSLAQAARIGRQIALGLADAHACGLIHRDIKPGNIWLDSRHQGRVKLLDFGLARGDKEDVQLTQSGAIVGTPAYMAPEQARGEKVDSRADLFSLGVVLYRLTTGQMPFRGDNPMSLLTSLALDTPTPPREIDSAIPPRMAELIESLLTKDREKRPATAKVVAEELAAIEREATQPTTEERTVQVELANRQRQLPGNASTRQLTLPVRHWLVAASVLLLAGVAAAIVVIVRDQQGNEIARVNVPEGGSIEIKDDGKGKAQAKAPPAVPRPQTRLAAAPLLPLSPGEPLAAAALVRQPAKLPGVRSWTIEPRVLIQPQCMAYRPDGKRLAVGNYDGRIHIWEPQTGRLVQVLFHDVQTIAVWSLAWSPDGRVLAAGMGGDRPIRLWDAETGRLLVVPESLGLIQTERIDLLAWSKDGQSVLAYSPNPPYSLAWDAAEGKLRRKVEVANGPLSGKPAVLSPDGKRLFGIRQGIEGIFVWDMETGKEMGKKSSPKGDVRSLALSADGKLLAWGQDDGLHIGEVGSGKEIVHKKLAVHAGHQIWCSWSPDGRFLDFASPGLTHTLLDARTDDYAKIWNQVSFYRYGPYVWSPDSKTLAVTHNSDAICLLEAATGKLERTLNPGFTENGWGVSFALSPDGKTLALYDGSRTLLAAMDTGQPFAVLGDGEPTSSHTWSPDGKCLAANQTDGTIILWEEGGKVRVKLTGHHPPAWVALWLAWSPDGKRLASSCPHEKRVLLWDVEKAERLRELGPFASEAQEVAWSPDGRFLAFCVPNVGWNVWDVEKNKLINDPKRWKVPVFQFAPDGRSAVVAVGPLYRLRDLATGEDRGEPSAACTCVRGNVQTVLSPDGRLLATPLYSSDIALLRSNLGGRARVLKGTLTPYHVSRYEFLQDGKLTAGLAGEYVHLWETGTGRLRGILLPRQCYNGLTLTPDGHYTGNEQVERGIVMVVQKDDGTQEVLEPADFEQKFGWKNDPDKVHLLRPLPPSLYPQPGQPMGPYALVQEPAELPDAGSWTIETVSARGAILAGAYRPDGKLLALGGKDGAIRIWDAAGGKLVRMLIGDSVSSLSWSKDGKILAASGGEDVQLWEVDTGRLLRRLPLGDRAAAWSPSENILAVINGNGRLSLWDAASEQVVRTFEFQRTDGMLVWSPDGKTLALGFGDRTIRLWDVASGKEVRKLEGHESTVVGIAWSPDGKRLVSTAINKPNFLVWDAAAGKLVGRFPLELIHEAPKTLAWTPDGKGVVLGTLGVFDPGNGQRLRSFDAIDRARPRAAWSADFKQMATFGERGEYLFDIAGGKRTHTLAETLGGAMISVNWSPDNRFLAVGTNFAAQRIVEAATGQRRPAPDFVWTMADWSPDGKTLAVLDADGHAQLWDAGNNRLLRGLEDCPISGYHRMLAWSPDGKALAAAVERAIWVWSPQTGKLRWQHDKQQGINNFAWSPDSRRLAAAGWEVEEGVHVWDADTGKLLHKTPMHSLTAAWSPDGKTLAARKDHSWVLIDSVSGVVRIEGKEGATANLVYIQWSPDGKTFSTIDGNNTLRVWDSTTGEQRRAGQISALAEESKVVWSPDGRMLARSDHLEIRLHDSDGHPLGVLLPFSVFGQLAVVADGRYRGNARVERLIRMVVHKPDGTTETLTPREFQQKYGFKNEPDKVRLTDK